jgi:hypothetical protein
MMEAMRSFETSVLIRAARRIIPEDGVVHSQRRKNLKSYMDLFPSSGEGSKRATLLGELKRPNRNDWIQ